MSDPTQEAIVHLLNQGRDYRISLFNEQLWICFREQKSPPIDMSDIQRALWGDGPYPMDSSEDDEHDWQKGTFEVGEVFDATVQESEISGIQDAATTALLTGIIHRKNKPQLESWVIFSNANDAVSFFAQRGKARSKQNEAKACPDQ